MMTEMKKKSIRKLCIYEYVGTDTKILDILDNGFVRFLSHLGDKALKKEFLLPIIIDQLIKEEKAEVKY